MEGGGRHVEKLLRSLLLKIGGGRKGKAGLDNVVADRRGEKGHHFRGAGSKKQENSPVRGKPHYLHIAGGRYSDSKKKRGGGRAGGGKRDQGL